MRNLKITYDGFIRGALSRGFTDDQVDFLWDMFAEMRPDPDDFPEDKRPVCERCKNGCLMFENSPCTCECHKNNTNSL